MQRDGLRSAAGELPPDQCLPEVWIDDPRQEAQAREDAVEMTHYLLGTMPYLISRVILQGVA